MAMNIRVITEKEIENCVSELCRKAACVLPCDVASALQAAYEKETSETAKSILLQLIDNQRIARERMRPCCQDTGMAVVFVDIGNSVVVDGDINAAIHAGVAKGYGEGYMRKSTLTPLTRKNLGDNTPAIIHISMHVGDSIRFIVAPKGFGSENMSKIAMLKPSQGIEGVKEFILNSVKAAGGNPCPPMVVGVGIGGNFEECALLAKKQLLRKLGTHSNDTTLADMEQELLTRVNELGIGVMGLGGNTTALAVNIGQMPTHLAGLPVAVNIQCHACRHAECEL